MALEIMNGEQDSSSYQRKHWSELTNGLLTVELKISYSTHLCYETANYQIIVEMYFY